MIIDNIYKITPNVLLSSGSLKWHSLPTFDNKSYMLCHPAWHFGLTSLKLYYSLRNLLKSKNIELILLHNSKREYLFSKLFGFNSFFLNQNMHANENLFEIKSVPKVYDAVYIAAAKKYKRLHLIEKIKNIYVVTYMWGQRDEKGKWNLHKFEPKISHAHYNDYILSNEHVHDIITKSKVGLALSKKEGAMWAVMEYLLSGLPIVSTKSLGGRDFYFDNKFVNIVKSNSEAVRTGVKDIIRKNIDPYFIRNNTMKKINKQRIKFYDLVIKLSSNSNEPYKKFYDRVWGGAEGIENCNYREINTLGTKENT